MLKFIIINMAISLIALIALSIYQSFEIAEIEERLKNHITIISEEPNGH